jgi:triacylglycerol lipase
MSTRREDNDDVQRSETIAPVGVHKAAPKGALPGWTMMTVLGAFVVAAAIVGLVIGAVHVKPKIKHAVILVSGGGTVSPYTTPWSACKKGFSAGLFNTPLRDLLLPLGYHVFSAPSRKGVNAPVPTEDPGEGGFGECPAPVSLDITLNSVQHYEVAGAQLAGFVQYLHEKYGYERVDFLGNSMGGLASRVAIRLLKQDPAYGAGRIKVRALFTFGTPHEGSYPYDILDGALPESFCDPIPFCRNLTLPMRYLPEEGVLQSLLSTYMVAPGGWNEQQEGVLDGVATTLYAGDYFKSDGSPLNQLPSDGHVLLSSALGFKTFSSNVWPLDARRRAFKCVHSLWVGQIAGAPIDAALSWHPPLHKDLVETLRKLDAQD